MLEIKNTVVVVVFIFLKHNGLCGKLADSNNHYTKELIPCSNFCVQVTMFVCTLRCEGLLKDGKLCLIKRDMRALL